MGRREELINLHDRELLLLRDKWYEGITSLRREREEYLDKQTGDIEGISKEGLSIDDKFPPSDEWLLRWKAVGDEYWKKRIELFNRYNSLFFNLREGGSMNREAETKALGTLPAPGV